MGITVDKAKDLLEQGDGRSTGTDEECLEGR